MNKTHIWLLTVASAIIASSSYFLKELQAHEAWGLLLLFIGFPLLGIYNIYRFKNNESMTIGLITVKPEHGEFYPIIAGAVYLFFIGFPFLFGWGLQ